MAGLLCVLSVVLAAQTTDRSHTEALARRASERLQALQREADRLTADERTLLGDLRKLEVDRQIKAEELHQVEAQETQVAGELEANAERTRELEAQETTSRPQLRSHLVDVYKLGQGRYLRLLLSTHDMRQVGQAARTLAALAKLDHDRIVVRQRTLQALRSARATLEVRRHELNKLRASVERAAVALEQSAAARNALIRDIDSRRDLNAQLVSELQVAQQKLQVTLRELANGAQVDESTLPIRPFRGDLDWPIAATGNRRPTRSGTSGIATGLEISAAEGAAVSAVHEGTVAFADAFGGFGNLVIVEHGAQNFSLYGNLLEITVAKGDRVERGQPIGTVGLAPAGSSELHFELRIDGQSVDPLQWLKKRP
ncbi:MAG TPA: peptidoglycan DD-metalloendopeptidase family protein [Vicinamibacterales bacterium]|nr:peptidoglycan DD-metalloendopeptidase family protein [Vicinamibacterales bacterium]